LAWPHAWGAANPDLVAHARAAQELAQVRQQRIVVGAAVEMQ
jgi:hypothetical protein